MTEEEWLTSTDPQAMLAFLKGRIGDSRGRPWNRKFFLFACACCRRVWHLYGEGSSRRAVEVTERFADGLAIRKEYGAAAHAAGGEPHSTPVLAAAFAVNCFDDEPVDAAAAAAGYASSAMLDGDQEGERAAQAAILRCVSGNPFRPLPPLPASLLGWNDRLVVRMATAIYEERSLPSGELGPARLAVLCDALLDAGCPPDHELLLHLRGPGAHVRGCYAVDLFTAREE